MQELEYTKPAKELEAEIQAFANAFYEAGEQTINGSGGLDFYPSFDEWLAYLGRVERGEEEGFAPSRVWLARAGQGGPLVGILDIRPTLPPEKLHFGHIGYAVAPRWRGKGYATQMLAWGVEQLQAAGVRPIVACCYAGNTASRRALEKGGFEQINAHVESPGGKTVLMFEKG